MFISLTYDLLGYDIEQSSEMPRDSPLTPLYVAKRQKQSTLGANSDWNYLVESKLNKLNYQTISTLLNLQTPIRTTLPVKNTDIRINTNSVLFSNIRVIHYTLHLLYEDFKLNATKIEQLPFLARFLSKLSSDLNLKHYVMYYWKDFPNYCMKYNSETSVIGVGSLKNVITWPCMQEQPNNVMEYIYCLLLNKSDVSPYPYIPNVNERSKAIVQLCGIYIKGSKCERNELSLEAFVNNVLQLSSYSTPKAKLIYPSEDISEKVTLLMTEMGIASRDLDSFPIGINLLLYGALWKCREKPPVDWCPETYNLLQRPDLAAQAELIKKNKLRENAKKQLLVPSSTSLPEILPTMKQVEDIDQEDGMEDIDSPLLKMRFPEDHRVTEARRLLQSSKPVTIALVQRPDVADHDFIEEQEKHLYAICARTMALPVGRGMFTLRTATPVVTEPLPLPKLYLSGKAPPRGITVELGHIDYPQNMQHWPLFHNGVANGLRISPDAHNIDSTWIIFNKPKNSAETNYEHAGFLMALGLNGHLTNLTILNTYNYLSKSNEMTSIGILLGLASAMRGTANTMITKVLSVHLEALLPPTSMELDVTQNLQVAALLGVGLAYQGTAHRHITEVLLWEIGRPPGPEMENSTDRESYSLAAGLALGLVTLQQGGRPSGLSDLNVPDTLHYYMVGGNKRVLEGSQRDKYRVPSFQIREGSNVNLDVTAPGATLALGLMYMKTGNKTLADWMSPPTTQYLLDFVRPDFLMLRILSRSLILWDEIRPDRNWIEEQVPASIRPFCMVKPTSSSLDVDYEAMNQAYCNIIAGACFAVGLKFAGSANDEAFAALLHFCHMFISLTSKSIAELAGKPTIETCLNVLLLSASMVMAGTGNLQVMRIVRHLRRRVGLASSAVVTYGSHLAIHMALGLLFLGGGRYTLSNSPASVAALICAFYPKFPTHSADNRYHLQAFRHLYVLAVEPRLIIPKDVSTGRICYASLKVVYLDGSHLFLKSPCLIPDLNLLAKVSVEDERYWGKLLTSTGLIEVKQRAGCLSYVEDKFGYRTELARTLTHSKTIPWNPPPKAITSFSSNAVVRYFSDNFLNPNLNCDSGENESKFLKMITRATYECVIKDKETILSNIIALIKIVQDFKRSPNSLQIWQFKLILTQVLENDLSSHLISPEVMLSLKQNLINVINEWEPTIRNHLKDFITGKDLHKMDNEITFASYIMFYDVPFDISDTLKCDDYNSLQVLNYFSKRNLCNHNLTYHSSRINDKLKTFLLEMADENRIRSFKNKGKDTDEMRRRRVGQTIELRKARKDDQLLKRRNISEKEEATSPLQENNLASPVSMTSEEILMGLMSSDESVQFKATQACRKVLSREKNPPIDHMIRSGVVPRCVEFLGRFENPLLQFEACWALTNIASGTSEQTQAVVEEGAAVWALGNIAGDGPQKRDLVLNSGIMLDLLKLINPDISISLMRNIVWAISNLCRNKNPPPDFALVKPALPILARLLHHSDKDVLADTCWALSYLTDGSNDKIQTVLETGLIDRLVQLLGNQEINVLTPALRAVGNIVTGNDIQTDIVLNAGVLNLLGRLLKHHRLNIVKEAAWTVSNVTAGNSEQIQKVLDADIMEPLLNVLQTGDFKSQKEAAWAITNYTSGGTIAQLGKLVEMGVLKPMCNLLNSKDWKTVIVALDGLTNILNAANKLGEVEKVAIMIEECGGLDLMESLQAHENEQVYEKALSIIENYFGMAQVENMPEVDQDADGLLYFNTDNSPSVPNGGFNF
ncbi:hypothetical protein FQR65_LT05612 [Abscondita terminalis]|nr:hypothetical protein FQR65_LT05612 [Abscondita terminalis]